MMWWYQAGDAGWISFMFALLLAAAIGLLLAVVLRSSSARPWPAAHGGALDILRRRYAAGEITEAEFEQAKRVLGR
jgi:uncharacterized membrane protein